MISGVMMGAKLSEKEIKEMQFMGWHVIECRNCKTNVIYKYDDGCLRCPVCDNKLKEVNK